MKNTKKNLLFVCALEKELKVIKTFIQTKKPGNIQAHFLCTGIGNINTTLQLTQAL